MASSRRDSRSRNRSRRGQRQRQRPRERWSLPYTKQNWAIFGLGIGVILVGYLCLARPPVDGFYSLTLAPILLVLGYCVLIPIGLLIGGPSEKEATDQKTDNGVGV